MDKILWIPAFIFLLGTLVFFHEFGHFSMAKLLKIRVEEFAFGFGPKLIRLFRRGDTEYNVRAFPLGGFVRLSGENLNEPAVEGGFNSRPWYQRWVVYLSGPLASFVLGYVVLCLIGILVGLPVIDNVRKEIKYLNKVEAVMPGSLAQKAGLKADDTIVRINDKAIETGNEMVEIVHNSIGKPLTMIIMRNGKQVIIHATPKAVTEKGKTEGRLGFEPTPMFARVSIGEAIEDGNDRTRFFFTMITQVFGSGKEIAKNVGGPIAIASATKASLKTGLGGYLLLLGYLSLSLGLFNLMPIPVVDGGQMVLAVMEGINRRRLSQRTIEVAQIIGLATIAVIFVAVMFLDLQKLFTGQMPQ